MDCKRIQELLMTDYIDGEASEAVQKEIKTHLEVCAACKAFELVVREKVSLPFKNTEAVKPPEEVWQSIKEAIEEDSVQPFFSRLFDFLHEHLLIRRPAFALTTVITAILIGLFFSQLPLRKDRLVKDYLREQSEYILSLKGQVNGELEQDSSFGTTIEQYFF